MPRLEAERRDQELDFLSGALGERVAQVGRTQVVGDVFEPVIPRSSGHDDSLAAAAVGRSCRSPGRHTNDQRHRARPRSTRSSKLDQMYPWAHVDGTYFLGSGSWRAAAVVSGFVAAMLSRYPTFTNDQVKYVFQQESIDFNEVPSTVDGYGKISPKEAIRAPKVALSAPRQSFQPALGTSSNQQNQTGQHERTVHVAAACSDLVRRHLERGDLVGRHLVRCHLVRSDLVRRDLVRRGLVRRHLVRRHLVRRHLVRRDLVRRHLVRCHLVRCHLVRRHLERSDLVMNTTPRTYPQSTHRDRGGRRRCCAWLLAPGLGVSAAKGGTVARRTPDDHDVDSTTMTSSTSDDAQTRRP